MDSLVLIALGVVLVVAVALFAGIGMSNKKRSGLNHAHYQKQWKQIEAYRSTGGAGLQLSVMEADKLLDQAMIDRGMPGQTMGERLKNANRSFMNVNAIWRAHKLRNRLAHEQNVNLNGVAVDAALRALKAGLKDLGAL